MEKKIINKYYNGVLTLIWDEFYFYFFVKIF